MQIFNMYEVIKETAKCIKIEFDKLLCIFLGKYLLKRDFDRKLGVLQNLDDYRITCHSQMVVAIIFPWLQ